MKNKVMIVCKKQHNGKADPFIVDQVNAINRLGVKTAYFYIEESGFFGYWKGYFKLLKAIKKFKPNLIHAHYGLSALLSSLQRKVPVISTFHGCDINVPKIRKLSNIASKLSCKSIYVSKELADLSKQKQTIVLPCGVDLDVFYQVDKVEARKQMGLKKDKKYILFSSSFSNKVKNHQLAKDAISVLNDENVELVELKGFNRDEVALLMNAVDLVLLTSLREGSPQFIKEALACNTPIVSLDVGDVKELIEGVEVSFLSSNDVNSVADKIAKVLSINLRTSGWKRKKEFDNREIAKKLISIYDECTKSNK